MKSDSNLGRLIAMRWRKEPREPEDRRLLDDRRWCSERRIEPRRREQVDVSEDRRRGERRVAERRSGRDRRGSDR